MKVRVRIWALARTRYEGLCLGFVRSNVLHL